MMIFSDDVVIAGGFTLLASSIAFLFSLIIKKTDKKDFEKYRDENNIKVDKLENVVSQNVRMEQKISFLTAIMISVAKQTKAEIPEL